MISPQEHSTFGSLKVPAAVASHPQISAELSLGECMSENDWLAPLLSNKVVAEFGCCVGLRTSYLAPNTRQIICTDPDEVCLRLARQTLQLNHCRNTEVVEQITQDTQADVMLFDTRRYFAGTQPEFLPAATLLVITGPLPRSTATRVLAAGNEHLPQYHRAAVFAAPRRQHGFQ